MKLSPHRRLHKNHQHGAGTIEGHATRRYDLMARFVMRRVYWRIARDLALAAPHCAAVLDVGTGPGVLLMELGRRRPDLRLTGVDLSADMVAVATKNLRGTASVRVADAADLPFGDNAFDLVVSSFSLHHWSDPDGAGDELRRVLAPAGSIYVYDFDSSSYEPIGDGRRDPFRTSPLLPRSVRHVVTSTVTSA